MVVQKCHVDLCLGLRRCFTWSSPRERSKWHEKIFQGNKDESEIAVVGTPDGIVFSRSIRRVPKEDSGDGMLFNSIRGAPWELQPRAEGGAVNRVQLDAVELARYGYTERCLGCQHARLDLKPADHNEECLARIVRNITADDNLNQRGQIAQDRLLKLHHLKQELVNEILCQQERRSDSQSDLKNKHLRVQLVQIHGVPVAVRAVQAAVPVRIPAAVKPRLHHRCRLTKALRTVHKDRKLLMVLIWNWKGW